MRGVEKKDCEIRKEKLRVGNLKKRKIGKINCRGEYIVKRIDKIRIDGL